MVNDILERMYNPNIPKSYLTSIPLIISQQASTSIGYIATNIRYARV